jgi:hypothetical protein
LLARFGTGQPPSTGANTIRCPHFA